MLAADTRVNPMRRADRLFQIIQSLRNRRTVTTARRLADELEVSERTIYRDIQDLMSSGIPIEGEAGVGYILRRGFDLPPLMFTREEIEALVAGARWVQSWTDPALARAAAQALGKIETVAPPNLRDKIANTQLFMPDFHIAPNIAAALAPLRSAIDTQQKVRIAYTREDGAASERVVHPLACFFWGTAWTLAAWCELRADFRSFRLDRIHALSVLPDTFPQTPGRALRDYLLRVCDDGTFT